MIPKEMLESGKTYLGIEFGSTNIKAVLIGEDHEVLASGSYRWASSFVDGYFTYSMEEVRSGLRAAYGRMKEAVKEQYQVTLKKIGCIGISAMMHGYLVFDENDHLLVPFRTWQNTTTEQAAKELSELFQFNIPERWSISHLYQAILDKEAHVPSAAWFTTLAGYVHYLLTGKHVIGIGDASGMFPIDSSSCCYDERMIELFRQHTVDSALKKDILELLPQILLAGENAGTLTAEGAALLDEGGDLETGILLCPPEGDAGTGMTATNAVRANTGNVSAGTSIFSMIVLDKPLQNYYREIDVVTTPTGRSVAMVHCNNCTNDMNAWAFMLGEFIENVAITGAEKVSSDNASPDLRLIYETIYRMAPKGEPDCGGVLVCNYIAGEPVTGMTAGFPMVYHEPGVEFRLANLCRAILYSTMTSLKIGMDVLKSEEIRIDRLVGHGGLFKNGTVAADFLASALRSKVCVMETAEVGGPYGMALLAQYCKECQDQTTEDSLDDWLETRVFHDTGMTVSEPSEMIAEGFDTYVERFQKLIGRMK